MSFRKEKKFKLSKFDFDLMKNKLCMNGMQLLYAKRVINSLYYDTWHYNMFNDSEEGLLPRKKVRIRWYDDIRKANKEVKISSTEGRFKKSRIVNFTSELEFPNSLYDLQYGIISPSLFVSYTREYFSFKSMRITFDFNIEYVNYRRSRSISHKDSEGVMEAKLGLEIPDDYIENILPFPITRFSKYCRGVLISNGEM